MTVSIITIGDEILIGQIIDTNSAWMAQQLNAIGASIKAIHSVSDTTEGIVKALQIAIAETDVILLTGGLGPTKDDITKKTLATFLGADLAFHEPTWQRIEKMFRRRNIPIRPAHKEQCFMPSNATILTNQKGTAPGMWMEHQGTIIVSMPGVPYEMKYLMEFEVLPKLVTTFPGQPIAHRTILTVGEGESSIAHRLEKVIDDFPKEIKIAYLPGLGQVRVRLTATGATKERLDTILDEQVQIIEQLLPNIIFGYEKDTLAAAVGRLLKERNLTVGTAESCTGGLLANQITAIPGSSAYFEGSVVAYSYRLKGVLLDVSKETLEAHGAVSEETVIEMAKGALKTLGVDIAVSISGIAGPGGGMPDKPVGTVWLAIADAQRCETKKLQISKDRTLNIKYTCVVGLNMIRRFVKKYYPVELILNE